jgi:hypothetical protein
LKRDRVIVAGVCARPQQGASFLLESEVFFSRPMEGENQANDQYDQSSDPTMDLRAAQ